MNFKKRTNFLFGVLLLTGSLLAQNVLCIHSENLFGAFGS